MTAARIGAGVRRFLAQGRPARLAACVVVALAAVVWLGVMAAVVRVVVVGAMLLAAVWFGWLIAALWWGPRWQAPSVSVLRVLAARVRLQLSPRIVEEPPEDQGTPELVEPEEAALAAFRRSADALTAELLGRQERLHADAESLQRALASQIETLRAVVDRLAQVEQDVSPLAGGQERAKPDRDCLPVDDLTVDPDLRRAFEELEEDLRLEKIEEREQMLSEWERRLDRREREISAFVAETQTRLS
jgi:hypothetical protein